MKYSILFLFFCAIIVQYDSVNGGLVKNFFDKIHDTAQDVREDVRDLLHIKKKKDSNETAPDVGKENGDEKTTVAATVATPSTEKIQVGELTTVKSVETTTTISAANVTEAVTVSSSTAAAAAAANGTEDKGRENFKGACTTGYYRTPDGRCKPTF